jgi:hypothetical protein
MHQAGKEVRTVLRGRDVGVDKKRRSIPSVTIALFLTAGRGWSSKGVSTDNGCGVRDGSDM